MCTGNGKKQWSKYKYFFIILVNYEELFTSCKNKVKLQNITHFTLINEFYWKMLLSHDFAMTRNDDEMTRNQAGHYCKDNANTVFSGKLYFQIKMCPFIFVQDKGNYGNDSSNVVTIRE